MSQDGKKRWEATESASRIARTLTHGRDQWQQYRDLMVEDLKRLAAFLNFDLVERLTPAEAHAMMLAARRSEDGVDGLNTPGADVEGR